MALFFCFEEEGADAFQNSTDPFARSAAKDSSSDFSAPSLQKEDGVVD